MVSGAGVGSAWPMAPYTEVLVCDDPPTPKFSPVFRMKRFSPTWLVEFPLKRLLVLIPFMEKLLLVSRCPLATIAWLPKPVLAPPPPRKSAFTPGDMIASCVKLPVPSGVS